MFKKRTINKPTQTNDPLKKQTGSTFSKRPIIGGIDLRMDIEQLETNIKHSKIINNDNQKHKNMTQKQDQQEIVNKVSQSYGLPKTKKINKFTSHIMNKLPTMNTNNINSKNTQEKSLKQLNKQTETDNVKIQEKQSKHIESTNEGLVRPVLANYGLLDKSHFKENETKTEVIQQPQHKTHQQALMDYYIKKKMQELTKTTTTLNPNPSKLPSHAPTNNTYTLKNRPIEAWEEVLHLQNQYLTQQQKIKQYSIQQIQKKLQKQAQQIIKSEIQKRNYYLKDLLENQFEKMEYASKKQLKIIRQDKQRIEKQLNSKYKDTGRRHFIDTIKNSVL